MASPIIKGTLTIETDSLGIEASIVCTPQADGQEWNSESILKLIAELRITPAPTARTLDEALQKWAKVKEKVTLPFAKGQAPIPPTPEFVAWEDLPIDPELAPIAEEAVKRANPPELFRIKVEKIKRETIVRKPGPLPFLPPKEEVVVTWDKQEIKEPVFVDANVLETRYAQKGAKLGTVGAPRPGKPGKSVFGKTIPAENLTEPLFLLGPGIARDKNDLRAERSGVVRIGANWADILPVTKANWRIDTGVDGTTLLLWFEPGDRRLPRPTAAQILESAATRKPIEELLGEAELEAALDTATRGGTELEAFPLSRRQDAVAEVVISPEGLRATLHLRKAVAGARPLELRAASDAIRNSKVRGFKPDEVKAAILAFFKGTDVELADYLLVEGKAPTRGKDREIKAAIPFLAEAQAKEILARLATAGNPADRGDGFPAEEATEAAYVKEGTKVATIVQGAEGTPGMDVYGNVLPALPGNDPEIHLEGGLHLSRNEITAESDGLLIVKKEGRVYHGRVIAFRDCSIAVTISPDAMTATVDLEREEGAGLPLNLESVNAALMAEGIVKGIQLPLLTEAIQKARQNGSVKGAAVAEGEPAVPGGSAALNWLVHLASGKAVSTTANGRVDFKNQDRFSTVAEGTPLVEIVQQGAEGRPGCDILGKTIESSSGTAITIEHDQTIKEEKADGVLRLLAAKTGELLWDGKTLKIAAFHGVKGDVCMATGNIKFPGEIRVSGNIAPGFAVMGDADVLINGTAEAALISAGGRVVVAQGVIGGGKGIIRARKGIDAGFVEQATLLAVEDIRIKNGCLQSHVKTNGKLRLLSEKGNLIGGFCRARFGVECAALGNERGTRTEISFGQDYLTMDQIEVSEREIEKIKAALAEIDRRIKLVTETGGKLDSLRTEKVRLMKLLEQHTVRLFTLREKYEEHHPSEIRVRGPIFPGVILESHGRYYEVKQRKGQLVFVFDRELGRIAEKPLK